MTKTQELIAAILETAERCAVAREARGEGDATVTVDDEILFDASCRLDEAASALEHLVAERDAAVAAEREACAQIADARKPLYDKVGQLVCSEISSSIRARNAGSGEQP